MGSIHEINSSLSPIILLNNNVHVWTGSSQHSSQTIDEFMLFFSMDEREMAGNFHFTKDRNTCFVARGMLRKLIAQYTGISTQDVLFKYTPYGKPLLGNNLGVSTLNFNFSHSGGMIVHAITLNRLIGVDVEQIRPIIDSKRCIY